MKWRLWIRSVSFAALLFAPVIGLAQPPDGPPRGEGRPPGPPGVAGGQPSGQGPLMLALDKDRDGVLSAEEIRDASESLRSIDRDRDGRIDRSELRTSQAGGAARERPARRAAAGRTQRGPGGFGPPPEGGPGGFGPPPDGGPGGFNPPRGGGPEGFGPSPPGGGPGGFGPSPGGPGGQGPGPRVGSVVPPFVKAGLHLDPEQGRQIQALESEVRAKLERILRPEQVQEFQRLLRRGPGQFPGGGPPRSPGGAMDDDGPPVRPGRPDEP